MRKKLRVIPAILMLAAAAVTSIICYMLKYEVFTMLWVLLTVMVLFYAFGDVIRFLLGKYVYPPQKTNEEKTEEETGDEGAVIEKETTERVDEKTKKQDE